MCQKEMCKICTWRNITLPHLDENTADAEEDACHTPLAILQLSNERSHMNKLIMFAKHEELTPLWKEICRSKKLTAGARVETSIPDDRMWFRFPLRRMRPLSLRPSIHCHETDYVDAYEGARIHSDAEGKFTMYHYTMLMNMVQPHQPSVGSRGILNDGGMRNGCKHGDGIGVYCAASEPCALFSQGDGWVMLELRCHPCLTRVKGGSKGRYVIKSDQTSNSEGAHCTDVEVVAMLHLYESLPNFMKF
jgi:hypothetical protein